MEPDSRSTMSAVRADDAVERAALLGYADQAHFIRDWSKVTGTTPGGFAARHR